MRNLLLLLLLLFQSYYLLAQHTIDSLFTLYTNSAAHDRQKIVSALVANIDKLDEPAYKQRYNQLLQSSKQLNDKSGEGSAITGFANYDLSTGEYTKAEPQYLQAIAIWKELNNKSALTRAYNNMGTLYQARGDFKKALEYHFNSLKLKEELKDEKGISVSYNNIANTYRQFKQPKKSIEYHLLSLSIREKLGDKKAIATTYANLGNAYGLDAQYKKAFSYFDKAIALQKDINDPFALGKIYNSIGNIYMEQGNYIGAQKNFDISLEYRKKAGDEKGIATSYLNIGTLNLKKGKLDTAKHYLNKALTISKSLNDKEVTEEATRQMAVVAEKGKDYQTALKLLQDAHKMNDSLFGAENRKAIAEIQTKYETEKKEAAIRLLQKENELKDTRNKQQLYIASGVIALLLLVSVFGYNYSKLRQQKILASQKLEMEKHRLHAIIQTQEEERKRISAELHDGIGPALSAVKLNLSMIDYNKADTHRYNTAMNIIDRSYKELRQISHTMMPAMLVGSGLVKTLQELFCNLSSSGAITFNVHIDEDIDRYSESLEINIYRIVQELTNNIIKHANATEVTVHLSEQGKELSLMIEDNGNGFDTSKLELSNGNGWSNIQSRLSLLGGSIEVDSKAGRKTTVLHIIIPLEDSFFAMTDKQNKFSFS